MKNQVSEQEISVGVDMGGCLWAVSINYRNGRVPSYYSYKDDDEFTKEEKLYRKLKELIKHGFKTHVFYEAGRYGFTPARIIRGNFKSI